MLTSGTRIGPYVIESLIGRGGMGEVYRAHDSRLKRDVALKLLPDSVAADADRLARFEREAHVLAALNHPHIAAIHGLEDSGGTRALVMELVEGPTLAERLAGGPIPPDEALPIARQIAEAIESAHEAGIIHRDLKPANIKVRPDGTVKVLDFGLAKALASDASSGSLLNSPTMTAPEMTDAGVILGTAAYMSPEQARGRAVDTRADIWAFGCVLYEMLSGVAAFSGDTMTDVIAAVVKNDPDWGALPAATPSSARRLLARCLQKDPRSRLRDIGDARLELDSHGQLDAPPSIVHPETSGARRGLSALAVLTAALIVALSGALLLNGRANSNVAPQLPTRLAVTFAAGAEMHLGLPRPSLAVSPDGRRIVYTAAGGPDPPQLWIRELDQFAPTPLAGTRNARMAMFSPDGRWIAFFADGMLKKIPATSGPPAILCDAPGAMGGTWTSKDEIVFSLGRQAAQDVGLWRVPAAGGQRQRIAGGSLWYPDALPGGNAVVVTTDNRSAATSSDLTIAAVDLTSGRVTPLFDGGAYARYAPTGHLVYLREGSLVATPFDAATLTLGVERTPVVPGVYVDPSLPGGNFALSTSGVLAYAPGDGSHFRRTVLLAGPENTRPLLDERRFYASARLSPDARRVAVGLRAWKDEIWTVDIARATFTRITNGDMPATSAPVWSPDGRHIAFALSDRRASNLFWTTSDGSRPEERLTTSPYGQTANAFSPDGKFLVFSEQRPDTSSDLFVVSLDGGRAVRPLLQTRFGESAAAISPDGRLIAYQSDRSGRAEVYLAAFPAMTSPLQVSSDGGTNPVWARDGRRLYYNRGYFAANIEVVDVSSESGLNVSRARSLGQFSVAGGVFDVLPDGRLLFVSGTGNDGSVSELRVVLNWFAELRQHVAPR